MDTKKPSEKLASVAANGIVRSKSASGATDEKEHSLSHPSFRRIVILVLDSLGVGALADAADFGDEGAHTLRHLWDKRGSLTLPNLERMGLLTFADRGTPPSQVPSYFTRLKEQSQGKDTTTGHWEMMGLILEKGFETFPNGFPLSFMQHWSQKTGCGFLANRTASGTQIIEELGEEHQKSGKPIIYTSADSVFQIAAHEETFGLERLYALCEQSRQLFDDSAYKVGRVIARPFVGSAGSYRRTSHRHDYSAQPPVALIPEVLQKAGVRTLGIGKIPDIFANRGFDRSLPGKNDSQSFQSTCDALEQSAHSGEPTFIFSNLNDLDMLYGHRRDTEGYAKNLELIDSLLPSLLSKLSADDLLMITADHGNDPSFKGTDHTREYIPLILFSFRFGLGPIAARRLADRETFADIGATLLENFGIPSEATSALKGTSLLERLTK